jgi:serine/threonine protein kinase
VGDVYLEVKKCNGVDCALAVKYLALGAVDAVAVRNELCNLRKLVHPNIVCFLTSFACDTHLAIVTECCLWKDGQPRTLHTLLQHEHPSGLPDALARDLAGQLLTAVAVAHQASVVHRDINLHNILVQTMGDRNLYKLADFGASKECQFTIPRTYRSTAPEFTSPERLRDKWMAERRIPLPPRTWDHGAEDMWAVGVVVLSALHGHGPLDSFNNALRQWHATDLAVSGKLEGFMRAALEQMTPRVTTNCCDLLAKLLTDKPDARPRAEDLLRLHPWVNGVYAKDDSYMPALLEAHGGRQSDEEFEHVLLRATRGAVPQRRGALPATRCVVRCGRVIAPLTPLASRRSPAATWAAAWA